MYVGIDIGGTKTLVSVLTNEGVIVESVKFLTPKKYDVFLLELAHTVHHLEHKEFKAAGAAAPGLIDRKHGRVVELGNLDWVNFPLQADCEKILKCPVAIDNDANLAGLGEAMLHKDMDTVLYVTISTGIGTGLIYKQRINPATEDGEGGQIRLPYRGRIMKWEQFASGRAIYNHFHKRASEISDEADWKHIVRNLALGFFELNAVYQPDLIIIGGSIGTYFDRWGHLLQAEMEKRDVPVINIPKIVQAQRPEEAVVYGCYELAKQVYGKHA